MMILKVLIILKREHDMNIVSGYLNEHHIEYMTCDYENAFSIWQNNKPDLLILDEHADNFNTREFIETIRKHEFNSHTYILVVEDEKDFTEEYLHYSADDFIGRPFSIREFERRMFTAKKTISLVEQNLIVYALTRVFEARDKGTEGHLSRVSALSKILLDGISEHKKYKTIINQAFKEDLIASCQLHDIGKIGIEDVILKKPGQYTKDEYALMKEHVIIGYDILKSIQIKFPRARFLEMALEITRHHHEKYDGTGYPDGLKGEDIPLAARIVGLADFYDALTSKRVYKRKYSHEESKKLILERKGTHFDADLVDVFIDKEHEFKRICETHGES